MAIFAARFVGILANRVYASPAFHAANPMENLLTDPWFYAVAIPAVILVGLAKGGLGGALAMFGVPLMALVMPPVQAAAIMLPILVVMDMVSLWAWRGIYDRTSLKIMLPGGLLGIAIGWYLAAIVTASAVKLIVGTIALAFALRYLYTVLTAAPAAAAHNRAKGTFWATIAGFTSFVAHAGGPPYQVYTLPLRQDPKVYTGTSVIFFSIMNAVKLVPYFALGEFDTTNLSASAVLIPLAPVATYIGARIVKRIDIKVFYPLMYSLMGLVAMKLIWDGVHEIWM